MVGPLRGGTYWKWLDADHVHEGINAGFKEWVLMEKKIVREKWAWAHPLTSSFILCDLSLLPVLPLCLPWGVTRHQHHHHAFGPSELWVKMNLFPLEKNAQPQEFCYSSTAWNKSPSNIQGLYYLFVDYFLFLGANQFYLRYHSPVR